MARMIRVRWRLRTAGMFVLALCAYLAFEVPRIQSAARSYPVARRMLWTISADKLAIYRREFRSPLAWLLTRNLSYRLPVRVELKEAEDGAESVQLLSQMETLESIALTPPRNNRASLTDASLIPLEQLTRLRRLELNDTSITDKAISRLIKVLPGCQVVRGVGDDLRERWRRHARLPNSCEVNVVWQGSDGSFGEYEMIKSAGGAMRHGWQRLGPIWSFESWRSWGPRGRSSRVICREGQAQWPGAQNPWGIRDDYASSSASIFRDCPMPSWFQDHTLIETEEYEFVQGRACRIFITQRGRIWCDTGQEGLIRKFEGKSLHFVPELGDTHQTVWIQYQRQEDATWLPCKWTILNLNEKRRKTGYEVANLKYEVVYLKCGVCYADHQLEVSSEH